MPTADTPEPSEYVVPTNDNNTVDGPAAEPLRNADVIIPQLAHLIGRSMAREDFAACIAAANDNDKGSEGEPQNGREPRVVQKSSSSSSSWTSAARRFASAISSFADSPFIQASSMSAQH